ncbi:MAG: D-alanine--D-alanine ligase [Bacteroidaceae bacterium]|nr:D-alanine--D-alanine ligase [Bacteroidaceae bacterium]
MKRNIAILAGGNSSEREISLKSADTIYKNLDRNLYNPCIVDVHRKLWLALPDGSSGFPIDKNDFSYTAGGVRTVFDYAYVIIHGSPGENGILEGYLRLVDIPFSTCNVLASALTFDKYRLNRFLENMGINVAKAILLHDGTKITPQEIEEQLGFPCFIKPSAGGSSFGTTKVHRATEVDKALEMAFKENSEVVVESFLEGTEVTCGCFKTSKRTVTLPVTEVVPKTEFFDYDAKYNGMVSEITPARIPDSLRDNIQEMTSRIYDIVGCKGIIRNDYIITADKKINLLEVNTTPGMTPTSFIPQQLKAAGLDLKEVLTEIIEDSFI